jgi:RNA ligase (TIGR02306 family)
MTRTLASIDQITNLRPIPGADTIEVGSVRGWNVVVKRGEYHEGDHVLFIEPDAALPLDFISFAFLRPRGVKMIDGKDYHVLKTVKLRGQFSQGIVFPVSEFAWLDTTGQAGSLDTQLGVFVYEPSLPAKGTNIVGKWNIPWLLKTDAERIQNLSDDWLASVNDGGWVATTKIDGSSHTVVRRDDGLHVYSRNWEIDATNPDSTVNHVIIQSQLADWMRYYGIDAVQGELFGEGIQSNRQGIHGQRFAIFAAWSTDITETKRHDRLNLARETAAGYGLYTVPFLDLPFPTTVAQALEQADQVTGTITPGKKDEGIVWHHTGGREFPELGGRIVFKAVSNRYLLKHGL